MTNKKDEVTGILRGWKKDPVFNIVWGHIYGDTKGRFADGTWIHTSDLLPNQILEKGEVIKTLNSTYLLGDGSET